MVLSVAMRRVLHVDRHWESPYALSAFVALEEKGLEYEVKEVALEKKENHRAEYRAVTVRIPALVEDDFWLAESSAIAEYLEEAYPPPRYPTYYPTDVKQRAVCRQVQAWLRSDLMPLRQERPTTSIFFPEHRAKAPLSAAGSGAAHRLVQAAERLLPGGRSSLFDAFCIADVDLALMLMRLHANADPLRPALARYAETQWRRPSVEKWVQRVRPPFEAS